MGTGYNGYTGAMSTRAFFAIVVLGVSLAVVGAIPAHAQELAVGAHVLRRDDASHVGGAVAAGLGRGHVLAIVEAGGTRREGHNDWRIVAGPRIRTAGDASTGLFAHALAGTVIRSGEAAFGWTAGVGADLRGAGRLGLRIQFDVAGERRATVSQSGFRASAWIVMR
jgi:hypothetical protein